MGWEVTKTLGSECERYLFVWRMSIAYDTGAEVIHEILGKNYQYTDQHVWPEWLETRLETIDDDVSVEIVPARTKWKRRMSRR